MSPTISSRNVLRLLTASLFAGTIPFISLASAQTQKTDAPAAAQPRTLQELGEKLAPGVEYPPELDAEAVRQALAGGLPYESKGVFGMSPHATTEQVQAAVARVKFPEVEGPFQPTWQSIADNYRVPAWLEDAKFGIFIHFGLYSIPAHNNEWYDKYMYWQPEARKWHTEHFGPVDKFGYKDFIPLFTLRKFNPNEWATAFKASGARWVMPTAEHHDGFSMWDSKCNLYNSVAMGPKRDFVGELGAAVRKQGMKYGVTNHVIEHYDFIEAGKIPPDVATDLTVGDNDSFYWTVHNNERMIAFLAQWLEKNIELIDQYHPSILWFDNGANHRVFDPMKLKVAAYYYNRARQWKEDVTITGKGTCFITGDIQDFETMNRAPREMTDFTYMVHDTLTGKWGYVEGTRAGNPRTMIERLVEIVCRHGVFALNVSPMGDGSIPDDQVKALADIGAWLAVNGEAIYGSRVWTKAGEGKMWLGRGERYAGGDIRFTTREGNLYAILMAWPTAGEAFVASLPEGGAAGAPTGVSLLGGGGLKFEQLPNSLKVSLPEKPAGEGPYVLRISGLKL